MSSCVQDDCRDRILCNPHYQKLEQAAGVWRKVLVVSASSSPLSVLPATESGQGLGPWPAQGSDYRMARAARLKVKLHCASRTYLTDQALSPCTRHPVASLGQACPMTELQLASECCLLNSCATKS